MPFLDLRDWYVYLVFTTKFMPNVGNFTIDESLWDGKKIAQKTAFYGASARHGWQDKARGVRKRPGCILDEGTWSYQGTQFLKKVVKSVYLGHSAEEPKLWSWNNPQNPRFAPAKY